MEKFLTLCGESNCFIYLKVLFCWEAIFFFKRVNCHNDLEEELKYPLPHPSPHSCLTHPGKGVHFAKITARADIHIVDGNVLHPPKQVYF